MVRIMRSNLKLFSGFLLVLFLFNACDGGPTPHVNFEDEFSDTKNVKTQETTYGKLLEKEYLNVYQIEKEFSPSDSQIDTAINTSTTTDKEEDATKSFTTQIILDNRTEMDKSDLYLNKDDQLMKDSWGFKCGIKIQALINGISIKYNVSKGALRKFYSFDVYKKECEASLKEIMKNLRAKSAFKFNYMHMQKELPVFGEIPNVSVKVTPLVSTALVRKIYDVNSSKLREHYTKFLSDIKEQKRLEDEKHPVALRKDDYVAPVFDAQMIIQLDPASTELSDIMLKLNGEKRPKELNQWRQNVYDPYTGVVTRTFFTILFYPFSLFLKPVEKFRFQHCSMPYISTTLQGVAIRMDDTKTTEAANACEAELVTFFAKKLAKFDYVRALPLVLDEKVELKKVELKKVEN